VNAGVGASRARFQAIPRAVGGCKEVRSGRQPIVEVGSVRRSRVFSRRGINPADRRLTRGGDGRVAPYVQIGYLAAISAAMAPFCGAGMYSFHRTPAASCALVGGGWEVGKVLGVEGNGSQANAQSRRASSSRVVAGSHWSIHWIGSEASMQVQMPARRNQRARAVKGGSEEWTASTRAWLGT